VNNLHSHRLDSTFGKVWKLREPVFDIRIVVVSLEIGLCCIDLIEDDVSRILTVDLEEVDEVLWVLRTSFTSGMVAALNSLSLPGLACTSAMIEYAPSGICA